MLHQNLQSNNKMKKTVLIYGIIGGLVVTLLFLGPVVINAEQYMDPENMASGEILGYSIMILSMLCVFFGVRHYRKKRDGQEFSFGKGMAAGVLITLVATAVFYIGNVVLYEVVAPDFLQEFSSYYKDYMLESASGPEERDQILAAYESEAYLMENSYLYALLMAGSVFFIGIIISLLSALILRRKEA